MGTEIRARLWSQNRCLRDSHMAQEHRALTSDNCLHIRFAFEHENPILVRQRRVECATKPLAPTSIVRKEQRQPADTIFSVNSLYLARLRVAAAGIPSSAPHVSSKSITCLVSFDHIIMSGRAVVGSISGGKRIGAWS